MNRRNFFRSMLALPLLPFAPMPKATTAPSTNMDNIGHLVYWKDENLWKWGGDPNFPGFIFENIYIGPPIWPKGDTSTVKKWLNKSGALYLPTSKPKKGKRRKWVNP